jgi:hypothetical protein
MLKDWLPDVIERIPDTFDWFPSLRPAYRLAIICGLCAAIGAIAIAVVRIRNEPLDGLRWWTLGGMLAFGVIGVILSIWYAATHEE